MFSGKGQIPCVGISFGVDRIFSIEKARLDAEQSKEPRGNKTDVFVMAFGGKGFDGMLKDRMKICNMLWDAGINTEMLHKNKPKLQARKLSRRTDWTKFHQLIDVYHRVQGCRDTQGPFCGHSWRGGVGCWPSQVGFLFVVWP